MSQKSYDGSPTLYLIPTPIGNLDDITLRGIKILNQVSVVFSEDTRETKKLLDYLDIKKQLISNHEHNELENQEKIIKYLEKGNDVGIVSDRGTPIISDPGYILTKYVIDKGYNVVGLPGATALIPALITSGIEPNNFTFLGFLDSKETKRIKQLEKAKQFETTLIIYESPYRIEKTLKNIEKVMGNVKISISREISKKYEEIYRGKISEIISSLGNIKGEIVIVVEGIKNIVNFDNLTVIEHVNLFIKEGKSVNEAMKLVAKERNISKKEIYNIYHNIK